MPITIKELHGQDIMAYLYGLGTQGELYSLPTREVGYLLKVQIGAKVIKNKQIY